MTLRKRHRNSEEEDHTLQCNQSSYRGNKVIVVCRTDDRFSVLTHRSLCLVCVP